MNIILLPKELQNLVGEFNVEHRPIMKVVLNELLDKYKKKIDTDKLCYNCGDLMDDEYTRFIFWNKYTFCGGWCQFDVEHTMRKSYRRSLKKINKN